MTPPLTRHVLYDIGVERGRQDAKWGEQSHRDGTAIPAFKRLRERARRECEANFAKGQGSWADILLEELFEALAESDPKKLREELIQVAAVAAGWAEAIDRR